MQTQPAQISTDQGNATHNNGNRGSVQLRRSRKGRTLVHLLYPSVKRRVPVYARQGRRGRVRIDEGEYRDDKRGLTVVLTPYMDWSGGSEVFIDAERGAQIGYFGIQGWAGMDGVDHMNAAARRIRQTLESRGLDFSKIALYGLGALVVVIGGFVAMSLI